MDFGVVHPLAFPETRNGDGPILESLMEIASDPLFGAVEIPPIPDPTLRKAARDLLDAAKLQVVYLPILPVIFGELGIGSGDESKRAAARSALHELLDQAIEFDAPLAMLTGPRDTAPAEREATTARLVEDIQELCDYADARSTGRRLHITLENFDRNIEKKRLIGPTKEAAALADAVDRDNFGLTVDLSHAPLLGESPYEMVQTAGRHIIHAHIGNCAINDPSSPLYGDFHPRFGHPEGCNDLPEVVDFIGQLTAVGFWENARTRLGGSPILSMEIKPTTEQETSATVLANGKRVFMRAWATANTPQRNGSIER